MSMYEWLAVPLPFLAWRTLHRGMEGRWTYGISLNVADAGLLLLIAWERTR